MLKKNHSQEINTTGMYMACMYMYMTNVHVPHLSWPRIICVNIDQQQDASINRRVSVDEAEGLLVSSQTGNESVEL